MLDPDGLTPEARAAWDQAFPDGFDAAVDEQHTPTFLLWDFRSVLQFEGIPIPPELDALVPSGFGGMMREYAARQRGKGYRYDADPGGKGGMLAADAELVRTVVGGAPLAGSRDHGQRHWRAVAGTGLRLAEDTPGADREVILLFGLFHDARRENEYDDPGHGGRGAGLARELAPLDGDRLDLLIQACLRHNGGPPDPDPTVGCCLDADRLSLPRVGVTVSDRYLSTFAARTDESARWALLLHDDPPAWGDLFRWVRLMSYAPERLAARTAVWTPTFMA